MLLDIIKGFLIGICASAPIGPIAILVMQKSLSEGHKSGFITGLGATLVDTVFAIIAIFALAIAQQFIDNNTILILIVGGVVVAAMGFSMAFNDPFRRMKKEKGHSYTVKDFIPATVMGISNPGAIFVIFALFAFFRIDVESHGFSIMPLILALSAGSAIYWFFFSWLFSHIRKNFKLGTMLWMNRISGIIVMIIGIVMLAEGIMKVIFV